VVDTEFHGQDMVEPMKYLNIFRKLYYWIRWQLILMKFIPLERYKKYEKKWPVEIGTIGRFRFIETKR